MIKAPTKLSYQEYEKVAANAVESKQSSISTRINYLGSELGRQYKLLCDLREFRNRLARPYPRDSKEPMPGEDQTDDTLLGILDSMSDTMTSHNDQIEQIIGELNELL